MLQGLIVVHVYEPSLYAVAGFAFYKAGKYDSAIAYMERAKVLDTSRSIMVRRMLALVCVLFDGRDPSWYVEC